MVELENHLAGLAENAIVLDLGCGHGSFHYETCRCRVISMDLVMPQRNGEPMTSVTPVCADSRYIPLRDASVDVVICHHTLEHFQEYKLALSEIARVLSAAGWLWIAIPNGYGFDDSLYRLLFSGGGHVNRFSYEGLVTDVEELTGLHLIQSCLLFSGFVYLKKPPPQELQHFPAKARFLAEVPDGFATVGRVGINSLTRIVDKVFGARYSQYGWAFVFAHDDICMPQLPSYFNVCRQCGSGNSGKSIKTRGLAIFGYQFYECPHCGEINLFCPPPQGLQ